MILQKVVCLGKYESKPVERLKLNYSLTKGVENCQDSSKFSKLELASTRLVIIIQYEKNFSDSTHKLAKTRLKSLKWKAKNFTYLFIGKAQGTYRSTAVDEINVKNRIDVGMLQCRKQIDQTGPVIQQNISSFRFIGIASM